MADAAVLWGSFSLTVPANGNVRLARPDRDAAQFHQLGAALWVHRDLTAFVARVRDVNGGTTVSERVMLGPEGGLIGSDGATVTPDAKLAQAHLGKVAERIGAALAQARIPSNWSARLPVSAATRPLDWPGTRRAFGAAGRRSGQRAALEALRRNHAARLATRSAPPDAPGDLMSLFEHLTWVAPTRITFEFAAGGRIAAVRIHQLAPVYGLHAQLKVREDALGFELLPLPASRGDSARRGHAIELALLSAWRLLWQRPDVLDQGLQIDVRIGANGERDPGHRIRFPPGCGHFEMALLSATPNGTTDPEIGPGRPDVEDIPATGEVGT